jgi:hypothetical protein
MKIDQLEAKMMEERLNQIKKIAKQKKKINDMLKRNFQQMERNSLTKKFKNKETKLFKMDNDDLFVIAFLDKNFKTFYHAIGKSGMDTKESSKWLYSDKAKEFMA